MSKLECIDLNVQYFGHDAVISGVTTTFSDGINVIYCGKQGGKTSFLKALSGVIPSSGKILFDGVDIASTSLKDRDFQMLFDDYALFNRRSARYNAEYPLKLRKTPKSERKNLVEEAAPLFDLDLMIDAPVYRLNEWHKISLVLLRAYLRKPKVLFIDNIFSKLDPQSRKDAFLRYIPLLAKRCDIMIYATDLVCEAAALTDQIKFMSYGYLLQEGSASGFTNKPACLSALFAFEDYSAGLPCVIESDGVCLFNKFFPLEFTLISDEYRGKEAIIAISSKHVGVSEEGFTALVTGKYLNGDQFVYQLSRDGFSFYMACERALIVGDEVVVGIKGLPKLFDPINERAIMRY